MKAKAAAAAAANNSAPSSANQSNTNNEESKNLKETEQENGVYGTVKEDYVKQPFKNAENAFKEAINMLSQEDWYELYKILVFLKLPVFLFYFKGRKNVMP